MIYYAKTNPEESIREHTDNVLKEFYIIKTLYRRKIDCLVKEYIEPEEFWSILKLCCEYHDYGKANRQFQNKLREKLGKEKLKCESIEEVPHNYLSPAFLPINELIRLEEKYGVEMVDVIFHAIAYHHERLIEPDNNLIERVVREDFNINLNNICEHMGAQIEEVFNSYSSDIAWSKRRNIKEGYKYYNLYILLKGLLHKIDHSASAHCTIEDETEVSISEATEKYRMNNNWVWREPQNYAKQNRNENLVIVASTGIGKTETALLWIDEDKAFFTLPLRVSINALFNRVHDEIGYKHVGLIHSTALDYLLDSGYEESFKMYEEAKLFSSKLSFSTIDQIFKYPFKYKGYEKVLATLSYSKVVIDEIQAYSPNITAVILYGIKQLYEMGGRFLIMTATFPRIYRDKLKEFNIKFKEEKFISDMKRHRIQMRDKEIGEDIHEIIERGKTSKVLVIVNTVDKALAIYNALEKVENQEIKLLHSMFTNGDRAKLEGEIKEFTKKTEDGKVNKNKGIWITTQIVEASLDIDFDYLYTEMSTLDSQFQRYGRCYRGRNLDKEEANVIIYTVDISGAGSIYDKEILELSMRFLKPYNNEILLEEVKIELVDKLYSKENLKGTDFYKEFIESCKYLDTVISFESTSNEAQRVLRNIESKKVIPLDLYNENMELFDKYKESKGEERRIIMLEINKIILNIPIYKEKKYKKKNIGVEISPISDFENLNTINLKYSEKFGLDASILTDFIF